MAKYLEILVDMDDVLVDFCTAAAAAHGLTRAELEARRPEGAWDLCEPLGVSKDGFWAPIHSLGEAFWGGLEPLPWADELVALISSITPHWFIVSAPARGEACKVGKMRWLARRFGEEFDRYIPTPYKWLLANPGRLLIDDRAENVKQFREWGGDGIEFPHPSNLNKQWASDPIPFLKNELETRYGITFQKRQ